MLYCVWQLSSLDKFRLCFQICTIVFDPHYSHYANIATSEFFIKLIKQIKKEGKVHIMDPLLSFLIYKKRIITHCQKMSSTGYIHSVIA